MCLHIELVSLKALSTFFFEQLVVKNKQRRRFYMQLRWRSGWGENCGSAFLNDSNLLFVCFFGFTRLGETLIHLALTLALTLTLTLKPPPTPTLTLALPLTLNKNPLRKSVKKKTSSIYSSVPKLLVHVYIPKRGLVLLIVHSSVHSSVYQSVYPFISFICNSRGDRLGERYVAIVIPNKGLVYLNVRSSVQLYLFICSSFCMQFWWQLCRGDRRGPFLL